MRSINICGFFIVLAMVCLSSCDNNNYPVDAEQLSGGYFCRVEGIAILRADNVLKPSIYGDVKTYSFNEDFIIIKQKPRKESYINGLAEELMAYRSIISKDSQENICFKNFILSNKDLVSSVFLELSPNHNSDDIRRSLELADSLVENDLRYKVIFENEMNYWIISHRERQTSECIPMSKIYGPFNGEEYLLKREEIGVPNGLKLQDE